MIKKSFTFKELSNKINISEVYLRNLSKKAITNEVYDPNKINLEAIKNAIIKKYNNHLDLIENYLECSIDEFEIITSNRSSNNYIKFELNDLVENEEYLLFSYVNKFDVRFIKKIELNNDIVFIFEIIRNDNKKNIDKYRILSIEELSNEDRFSIKRAL